MFAGEVEHQEEEPENDVSIVVVSDSEPDVYDSPVMLLNARRQRRNALAHIMDEDNEDFQSESEAETDEDEIDDEEDMLTIASRNNDIPGIQHHDQRDTTISTENNETRVISQPPATSKHKSTPPPDPTPKKIQRDSLDSQNENDSCPICFEQWCNSGKHKLVSLKCGHLFGKICIERWIKDAKRCPQCNMKAKKADIRVIYAKTIKALDTTELTEATNLYETERDLRKKKEMELAKTQMQYQMAMSEVNRLKSQLEDVKNQQVVSTLPKSVQDELSAPSVYSSVPQKFSHLKNVLVSPNGNCRVMDFHEESLSLAISQDSPHSSFMTGYGLKKFSVADLKSTQFNLLHSGPIRDIKFSPHSSLVLTASQDKSLKITNWESNSQVHTYKPQRPVWCCCWDATDCNLLYCGLNGGSIQCYDMRNTSDVLHSISNPSSRCPVVAIYNIPRQVDPNVPGGLLVQTLEGVTYWQQKASLSSEYEPHILPLQSGACAGLQYSSLLKQCLVTYRPGGNYRSTTHVLCQLKFPEETHGMSCEVIQTYAGGQTHKLLTRNAIMATESRENLVFVGDEAKKMVHVHEAKAKGNLMQTLSCSGPALDILPLHANGTSLLSTLSDKELKIYELK